MHGRAWAIWVGGIATGLAAAGVLFIVVSVSNADDVAFWIMFTVVAANVSVVGWWLERELRWNPILLAMSIGLMIGVVVGAYFNIRRY